jgi:nitrogenase molybdenum-iron protein alpha/beta subunit
VGHFFHRHEHEQAANLAELRRLAEGIGVALGPVLLSGEPLSSLLAAHEARAVLGLPYLGMQADALSQVSSRPAAVAGLPLGVRATTQWLRTLGSLLGADPERVRRFTTREEARAAPRLALARRVLDGRRLAVLADTPLAAGWVLLAEELGLTVSLVALLDRSLGGEAALRAFVGDAGGTLPANARVEASPSLLALRALGGTLDPPRGARPFDLAVRPDLGLSGTGWASLPTVETGFPARHKHFVYPLPELGYSGAVALSGRLRDAVGGGH